VISENFGQLFTVRQKRYKKEKARLIHGPIGCKVDDHGHKTSVPKINIKLD
jgi:hypothetical protein